MINNKGGGFIFWLIISMVLALFVLLLLLPLLTRHFGGMQTEIDKISTYNNYCYEVKENYETEYLKQDNLQDDDEDRIFDVGFSLVVKKSDCKEIYDNQDLDLEKDMYATTITRDVEDTGKVCCIYAKSKTNDHLPNAQSTDTSTANPEDPNSVTPTGNGGEINILETTQCNNQVKDGDEQDIDCGGSCDKCGCVFSERTFSYFGSKDYDITYFGGEWKYKEKQDGGYGALKYPYFTPDSFMRKLQNLLKDKSFSEGMTRAWQLYMDNNKVVTYSKEGLKWQ